MGAKSGTRSGMKYVETPVSESSRRVVEMGQFKTMKMSNILMGASREIWARYSTEILMFVIFSYLAFEVYKVIMG